MRAAIAEDDILISDSGSYERRVSAKRVGELIEAEKNCVALDKDLTVALVRMQSVQVAIDTVLEKELCSSEAHCLLMAALERKNEP